MADVNLGKGGVLHHVIDDGTGHVHAARFLNALEAWRRVDFQHQWAIVSFQKVNARNVEAQHAGCSAGCLSITIGQFNAFHRSVEVKVAAEFTPSGSSAHAGHDFVAHHQSPDVFPVRFGDVLLDEHRFPGHQQALDQIPNLKGCVSEEHPIPLGALGDFDHHGQATDGFNRLLDVKNVSDVDRFGNGDSISSKNLRSIQFVATLQNALAGVGRPNAKLLNVAQNSHAMLRDGMPNPWDDRIFCKGPSSMKHIDAALIHHQREFHWVADLNVQASFFRFLHDAPGTVEPRSPTENSQPKAQTGLILGRSSVCLASH